MSGVFRDPQSGEYRYYSWNDYEERRLRDWDDRSGYRSYEPYLAKPTLPSPPAPLQFAPIPELTPEPPSAMPVSTLKTPGQVVFQSGGLQVTSPDFIPVAQGPAFQSGLQLSSPGFVPVVGSWEGPTPPTAIAVPFNFQEFKEDWNASRDMFQPPARVGDVPEFDAVFDRLAAQGQAITYERVPNDLLASSLKFDF